MPLTLSHCPLCGSDKKRVFDKTFFKGQRVINQICGNCGFVYQSPRMTESELNAFYSGAYRELYQGDEGPTEKDLKIQKGRAVRLIKFAKGSLKGATNHLDIGCSAGMLLDEFRTFYGCKSIGVEPGDSYRDYAQSRGNKVYADLDELKPDEGERFDLVSMAHVLEHIADPVKYLTKLRQELMASDGYLLIEVPNLFSHDSFETAHMSSFSSHTLKQTLIKSGFSLQAFMRHGHPRTDILPLYLTGLAQAADEFISRPVKPEFFVKEKRGFGLLFKQFMLRFFPKKSWINP